MARQALLSQGLGHDNPSRLHVTSADRGLTARPRRRTPTESGSVMATFHQGDMYELARSRLTISRTAVLLPAHYAGDPVVYWAIIDHPPELLTADVDDRVAYIATCMLAAADRAREQGFAVH